MLWEIHSQLKKGLLINIDLLIGVVKISVCFYRHFFVFFMLINKMQYKSATQGTMPLVLQLVTKKLQTCYSFFVESFGTTADCEVESMITGGLSSFGKSKV
jgi:hypothetical protein